MFLERTERLIIKRVALLFLSAVPFFGVVSCSFPDFYDDQPMLNVCLDLEELSLTKATVGDIAANSAAEKTVHSLQIWVFENVSGNYNLVAYMAPSTEGLETGGEKTFSTTISKDYADAAAAGGLAVEVYALANATSIGLSSFGNTTTRAQLNAATMSGDVFGTTSLRGVTYIEDNGGLPMSAFYSSTMTGSDFSYTIPKLTLTRAVSKVRFVFCQQQSSVSNLTLTGLSFDTEMIPTTENVFKDPAVAYSTSSAYVSGTTVFPVTGITFPISDDCSRYFKSNSQTAQEYETIIDQAVSSNPKKLDQIGPYYFRESGKKITGEITYSYRFENADHTGTAHFSMADAGDFARNHSWTIYAYFIGRELNIDVVVNPWDPFKEKTSFSEQIGIDGSPEHKKITGHLEVDGEGKDVNHYKSNLPEVGSSTHQDYYSQYYQIRQINLDPGDDPVTGLPKQPCIEVTFRPFAPLGGYWMLEPIEVIPGSRDMMDVRVWDGESYQTSLMGQIMNMDVKIHITPSANYDATTNESQYAIILKCYFSPSISFDPEYSADSEFQDVHRDGRYSYWRFSLCKYRIPDYQSPTYDDPVN